MAGTKETVLGVLAPICGSVDVYEHRGDLTFAVDADDLTEAARELRDNPDTRFEQLRDVTAIDWYDRRPLRYDVIYTLYSLTHKHRIRLRVSLGENDPSVASLVEVWESANWYERETYDMYGIFFENHPDLRRFYMPEDYVDPESGEPIYPLRKDFPVMGVPGSLPLPSMNPDEN